MKRFLLCLLLPSLLFASGGTFVEGDSVTLSVDNDGTPPFTYQWFRNGTPISGATEPTLSFPSIQTTDSATYTVRVSNPAGSVMSDNASLTVNPDPKILPPTFARTKAVKIVLPAP